MHGCYPDRPCIVDVVDDEILREFGILPVRRRRVPQRYPTCRHSWKLGLPALTRQYGLV
jgi:hypothetical protein